MLPINVTSQPGNFVTIHSITTFIGVNLNRDFNNLPKQINIGGIQRLRVSAQSKGRAMRLFFREHSADASMTAAATRLLPQNIAQHLMEKTGASHDDAQAGAAVAVLATGIGIDWEKPDFTKAITTVPSGAAERLANLVESHWNDIKDAREAVADQIIKSKPSEDGAPKKRAAKKPATGEAAPPKFNINNYNLPDGFTDQARLEFAPGTTAELALFGRMLTELPDGEVYSSVQIAHSFGVDPYEEVQDHYTAVDDWQGDDVFGAASKGERYLANGTLYAWASLDRNAVRETLAKSGAAAERVEQLAQEAETLFLNAFVYAVPSGNRSRTGSAVLPTFTVACTTDVPLTAAGIYQNPVEENAGIEASHRLAKYLRRTDVVAPVLGGQALWLPTDDSDAPALPASITVLGQ